MDTLTPEQRSERMSRVKNRGSKAERLVRSLVHHMASSTERVCSTLAPTEASSSISS